jgi:hypothetical protein
MAGGAQWIGALLFTETNRLDKQQFAAGCQGNDMPGQTIFYPTHPFGEYATRGIARVQRPFPG